MNSISGITIVIPNLHSPIIDQVVTALRHQSWLPPSVEILLVGLDKYELVQDDEHVRLISTYKPVSPAQARNIGWRAAKHEVIIFLDADCVPHEDWLDQMLAFWDEHPLAGAILSGMDFDSRNFWTVCDQLAAFHEHMAWNPPASRVSLPSYALLVPTRILEETRGFDESFVRPAAEDLDLTVRIGELGYGLYLNPRAVVTHRPKRESFRALWDHGYWSGHESIGVRMSHRVLYRMPSWSVHAWAWRLFALPIAAVMAGRILGSAKPCLRYVACVPFILLAKFAWCLGAADALDMR